MKGMKWLDEKEEKSGTMDAYYGHHAKIETHLNQCNYLKKLAPQAELEPATR